MNKFQKVALQCAKDDRNKDIKISVSGSLKKDARSYYSIFKTQKRTIEAVLKFKEFNKRCKF